MALLIKKRVTLDISRTGYQVTIPFVKGDKAAHEIIFTVTDGSEIVSLPPGVVAAITVRNGIDSSGGVVDACIVDHVHNAVRYTPTPEALSVSGNVHCTLELTDEYGAHVGSSYFIFQIVDTEADLIEKEVAAALVANPDWGIIASTVEKAKEAHEYADAAAGSAEASAGSAKAASDSARASADSAEASAGSARSSAQSADDSENFANAAAASSNAAAKSAEDSESSAEASEIASKSFYDYIITTEDQFLSLPAYTGRILVKGVHLSQSADITLSQGTTLLEFRDCSEIPQLSLTIKAPADKSCTIRNFKLSGEYNFSHIYLKNFGRVENVEKVINEYLYLENCKHISNSVFDGATNCDYIDNCFLQSESDAFFRNCKFICGVETNDTIDNIEFLNCSFISNVNASGRYDGCTFVDPTSCKGFISSDDEGKVAKLSGTGEFNTAALPQAVVAEISDDKYILSIRLNDAKGNQIGAATTVDLPLEQMIVDVKYDEKNDSLIVELINGKTTVIPLGDIISGLATTLYVDGKANDLNAKIAELAAADKTHADDLAKLNSEYAEKIAVLDAKIAVLDAKIAVLSLTIGVTTDIVDGVLYLRGDSVYIEDNVLYLEGISVDIVDNVLCYSA